MNDIAITHPNGPLPKHRLETLVDGVYAIAITLLVLDLKVPEIDKVATNVDMARALIELLPNLLAWIISFSVLAIFWAAHHRGSAVLRSVDGRLIFLNVLSLAFVCFLPFTSALVARFSGLFVAQVLYAATMAAIGLTSAERIRYTSRHPELCHRPMSAGEAVAGTLRSLSVVGAALVAMIIAAFEPAFATLAFMVMPLATRLSRRFERVPGQDP